MSKLAHSNEETMDEIERAARERDERPIYDPAYYLATQDDLLGALPPVYRAAPDLLAFAKAFQEMADDVTARGTNARPTVKQLNDLWDQSRAAIQKATGGQS